MSQQITPQIVLRAYASGIFPMAEDAADNALYWVDPEERGIFDLNKIHIPRSLAKTVRQKKYDIRIDSSFEAVMRRCAEHTNTRDATWINERIIALFTELHELGYGHSVECWADGELVGGLYGIRLGGAFFGESMFSRRRDASKVALVHLIARLKFGEFVLLDAQFSNDHLSQFGLVTIPREDYHLLLEPALAVDADFDAFKGDHDPTTVLQLALQSSGEPV